MYVCLFVLFWFLSCGHCNPNRKKRTGMLQWPVLRWPTVKRKGMTIWTFSLPFLSVAFFFLPFYGKDFCLFFIEQNDSHKTEKKEMSRAVRWIFCHKVKHIKGTLPCGCMWINSDCEDAHPSICQLSITAHPLQQCAGGCQWARGGVDPGGVISSSEGWHTETIAWQKETKLKPKHPDRLLVVGCSVGHQPLSRTKSSKYASRLFW